VFGLVAPKAGLTGAAEPKVGAGAPNVEAVGWAAAPNGFALGGDAAEEDPKEKTDDCGCVAEAPKLKAPDCC
jgi:hypothetical protein